MIDISWSKRKLYAAFSSIFQDLAQKVRNVDSINNESIRIHLNDSQILIFTYRDGKKWKLETLMNQIDQY